MTISRSNDAWRQLARTRQEHEERRTLPARLGPPAVWPYRLARIEGGNSIQPGNSDGIAHVESAPTSLPAYDPAALPTTVDGVGVAFDLVARTYVLVANWSPDCPFRRDLMGQPTPEIVLLGPTISVPVTGGAAGETVTLYVPIAMG